MGNGLPQLLGICMTGFRPQPGLQQVQPGQGAVRPAEIPYSMDEFQGFETVKPLVELAHELLRGFTLAATVLHCRASPQLVQSSTTRVGQRRVHMLRAQ
jgi:hypothetical protein